jgi:hypothetical protein
VRMQCECGIFSHSFGLHAVLPPVRKLGFVHVPAALGPPARASRSWSLASCPPSWHLLVPPSDKAALDGRSCMAQHPMTVTVAALSKEKPRGVSSAEQLLLDRWATMRAERSRRSRPSCCR